MVGVRDWLSSVCSFHIGGSDLTQGMMTESTVGQLHSV